MAVSELVKEAAQRKGGLVDISKQVRSVGKTLTRILQLVKRITSRKKGLPSLKDLADVVKLIMEAMGAFQSLDKLIPKIQDIFKIVG
jgi:hypothetical protein